MVRRSSSLSLSLVVAALAGSASQALADSLPRLPGVVHLNPFIPGWFPLGPPRTVVVPPGGVDFADLNAALSRFGQQGPGLVGDVNGDGAVNFLDLNFVLANFGRPC